MTSRVHFIFTRFHTNFIDLIDELSQDFQIYWHVLFKHKNDGFLDQYNVSFISSIDNLNPRLKVGPIHILKSLFIINKNDTLVYRPIGNFSSILYFLNLFTVVFFCKIRGIRLLIYNQIDFDGFISVDKKFEFYKRLTYFHASRIITPIASSLVISDKSHGNISLIPFYIKSTSNLERFNSTHIKRVVFVGKLFEERKRFDIFLDVVEYYSNESNLEFVILGIDNSHLVDVKDDLLYKKFISLGVSIFVNLNRGEVYDIYSSSDYLIYCSEFEQAGVSPLEAMSCKVIPIVFSGMNKMNLSSNYINSSFNGFKVDRNNYLEYVRIINILIQYPLLEEDIKNNGFYFISQISKTSLNAWRIHIL